MGALGIGQGHRPLRLGAEGKAAAEGNQVENPQRRLPHRGSYQAAVEIHVERVRTGEDLKSDRVELAVPIPVFGVQHTVLVRVFTVIQDSVVISILGVQHVITVQVLTREALGKIQ